MILYPLKQICSVIVSQTDKCLLINKCTFIRIKGVMF